MQLLTKTVYGGIKRFLQRRRQGKVDGAITRRKKLKIIKIGETQRRAWKIKVIPRLRTGIRSPMKLLTVVKNAYMTSMIKLAGNVGYLNNDNVFGGKRIPKARRHPIDYSHQQVEDRLMFEIYQILMTQKENDTAMEVVP